MTKLKLAVNPLCTVAAGGAGLRDVRVTCKLPDAALIIIGGRWSAQYTPMSLRSPSEDVTLTRSESTCSQLYTQNATTTTNTTITPTIAFNFCLPSADSGVEGIDPLRFLAGCRKRRLNQALLSCLLA